MCNSHPPHTHTPRVHVYRANCDIQNVNSSMDCTLETNSYLSATCQLDSNTRLWIFTILVAVAMFLYVFRAVCIYALTINAARVLHNGMFASVLRAPVRFFDTNPSGESGNAPIHIQCIITLQV